MTNKEAIEILKDLWRWEHPNWLEKDIRQALEKGIEALENIKTGHWIKKDVGQVTTYNCSECGRFIMTDTGYDVTKDYPYCNCGAKME